MWPDGKDGLSQSKSSSSKITVKPIATNYSHRKGITPALLEQCNPSFKMQLLLVRHFTNEADPDPNIAKASGHNCVLKCFQMTLASYPVYCSRKDKYGTPSLSVRFAPRFNPNWLQRSLDCS